MNQTNKLAVESRPGPRLHFPLALSLCLAAMVLALLPLAVSAANPQLPLVNDPVDVSGDFRDFSSIYFLADHLDGFDPDTHSGKIIWQRARYSTRQAFDNMLAPVGPT